ncbi:nSTAND3 domain-containing NTPase [Solidesulfovibrio carbinolicus]|uniref:nSTAND3 domain-containing NTPase n=1 Tax=Solidesulfovibrio carbinolicus TaxID=296842 RepID=UPI001012A5F8|nr:ATP-binding protein [Solidesulfovibrio carbinolicus]
MGGPDNLRGMDYQVSVSLFLVLKIITGEGLNVHSIQFDSLDDEEEDLNVYLESGHVIYCQIKKKNESYHWTPSTVKPIFEKFSQKHTDYATYHFVTNAAGNSDVVNLKNEIKSGSISQKTIDSFCPESVDVGVFLDIVRRCQIDTRFFSSNDDGNPALVVQDKIKDIICRYPFLSKKPIDDMFTSLWKHIYDLSKDSRRISLEDIKNDFDSLGLSLQPPLWQLIPETIDLVPRYLELQQAEVSLEKHGIIVLSGISGVGKTSIAAHLATSILAAKRNVFWYSLNKFNSLDEFCQLLSSFAESLGHSHLSSTLKKADRFQIYRIIAELISSIDACFILDGFELCDDNLKPILVEAISHIDFNKSTCKLIVTSKSNSIHTEKTRLLLDDESIIPVGSLSEDEVNGLLRSSDITLTDENIAILMQATGGYPLAVKLFCQLYHVNGEKKTLSTLAHETGESAQDFLLSNVINTLSENEKKIVYQLSLTEYEFTHDDMHWLGDGANPVKVLLKSLHSKCLLQYNKLFYSVHDTIKLFCSRMMTCKEKEKIHEVFAHGWRDNIISTQTREGNSAIYYSMGFKWAFHIENAPYSSESSGIIQKLLKLSNADLAALWAVERFGYPFDFITADLSYAKERLRSLSGDSLIKKVKANKSDGDQRRYKLIGFSSDFFDSVFLTYLCITRGISNHLGYIDIHRFNYALKMQCNIMCPWEHCIELYPLPQSSREEQEAHIEFIKKQFADGAYDDKSPEDIAFLKSIIENGVQDDLPEEEQIKRIKLRCPIFGHCCPGGEEQAALCVSMNSESAP